MIKKILIFILAILFSIVNNIYANQVIYVWKDTNVNTTKNKDIIKTEINNLQKKYWINTDIVFFWKQNKECSIFSWSIFNCIKEKYKIKWDVILALNNNDLKVYIKDEYKKIISLSWNKITQNTNENILLQTLNKIENNIEGACYNVKNNKYWIKINIKDCNIDNLLKAKKVIIQKEKELRLKFNSEKDNFKIALLGILGYIIFFTLLLHFFEKIPLIEKNKKDTKNGKKSA